MKWKEKMMRDINLAVYVVTHGPKCRKLYDYCIPIEVGADSRTEFNYELKDNSGDNISLKNSSYNELTAMYWMWKNSKHDYIGLYHYRRIFKLKSSQITELLQEYDFIVTEQQFNNPIRTVEEDYRYMHISSDWDIMIEELLEMYPEYEYTIDNVVKQNRIFICNMFITSFTNFQNYCEWLFPLLFRIEERLKDTPRDAYQSRYIGFMAERLFTIYLMNNKFKAYKKPIYFISDNHIRSSVDYVISNSRVTSWIGSIMPNNIKDFLIKVLKTFI